MIADNLIMVGKAATGPPARIRSNFCKANGIKTSSLWFEDSDVSDFMTQTAFECWLQTHYDRYKKVVNIYNLGFKIRHQNL